MLVCYNGDELKIDSVQIEYAESAVQTYNFEVEGNHNYYVGDGLYLVHNKCAFGEFAENPRSLWGKSADEVGSALGDGWKRGTYGSKGTGWKFTQGDKMIAYHPGGGRHVGEYYKISSSALGRIKVVGSNYLSTLGDKATIINMF